MEVKNTVSDNSGQQLLTGTKVDSYTTILLYSFQDFLKWWYIKMPIWHLRLLNRLAIVVDDQLSLSLLAKTFFTPWHRDYTAMGFLFGIVMRLLYIPIATSIFLMIFFAYLAVILIWLILPIATITFIITSLIK
ncbi:TPA: hypothetical protein DCP76_03470 [Patescibacteria group bacterium]|nr:hypothetical protein [Patescibacteria group bacterium]HAM96828.1 hypothetical protein [Patescibacteria group bacterium]